MVITLDGRGDFLSGSVSKWNRETPPELISIQLELDSLGAFYGWITNYLKFIPDRHEGKVTGLAATGDKTKSLHIIEKMISFKNGHIVGNLGSYYSSWMKADLPHLTKELSGYSRADIAASTQAVLEDVVTKYVAYYLNQTSQKNLCLAGGIFANVLLNQKVRELPGLDNLFVFPHMGDGGISAGAAAYASRKLGIKVKPIKDAYLGSSFSEEECKSAIVEAGLEVNEPTDLEGQVASLINQGYVMGIFQGKMEYGPRALGNRSIIARTTDARINTTLNQRLNRSEFMPFAPMTLIEYASKCYVDWTISDLSLTKYMTCCFSCTDYMLSKSPAVVHIDKTARPQIIQKENNKFIYNVMQEYLKISDIPSIINTSFNEHEAPIVCNPKQAINTLLKDGVDYLVMPPFLVKKN